MAVADVTSTRKGAIHTPATRPFPVMYDAAAAMPEGNEGSAFQSPQAISQPSSISTSFMPSGGELLRDDVGVGLDRAPRRWR